MVFSHGKRCRVGGITVLWAPGHPDEVRVGLVASRRVGKAVVRNRVKRRLRAALMEIDPASGRDYVIVAGRQVAEAPFLTVVGWLRATLGQR
ncbi:MAG: ribonuclease P protein component [Actinomycetia bacterium]|nr:ribonuclease P protein component [Actinomycetes bacterium]